MTTHRGAKRNVLRTRLVQETNENEATKKYAVVTLKGNAQLVDGISRVEEVNHHFVIIYIY
jgi:hypothetical protein